MSIRFRAQSDASDDDSPEDLYSITRTESSHGILAGSWTCSEASPIQTDESGNQNNYLDITFEEEVAVQSEEAPSERYECV
jgi:hypothetical protein